MQWTMEEFRDPAELGEDELLALRAEYASEHRWLCLRRWALFDQIDLMRSERVRRLKEGLSTMGRGRRSRRARLCSVVPDSAAREAAIGSTRTTPRRFRR